jgi:dethiobiotin synthetase
VSARLFFVAGTDTDIGKTAIAAGLLRAAKARGLRTVALKPVAAGCEWDEGTLSNGDARTLRAEATHRLDHREVNPVALEPAIAPHVAAARAGVRLSAAELVAHCEPWRERDDVDWVVVEGAGGWLVPLNEKETLADVCEALGAEVILVVGMRLGCLNHALLTSAEVARRGLRLAGWVANCLPPEMDELEANITSLEERLPARCLGRVPACGPDALIASVAEALDLSVLLEDGT